MSSTSYDEPASNSKAPLLSSNRGEKIEMSFSTDITPEAAPATMHTNVSDRGSKKTDISLDYFKDSKSNSKLCGCCLMPSKLAKALEVTILVMVLLFLVIIFLVPIVVHYKKEDQLSSSFAEGQCSHYKNGSAEECMLNEISTVARNTSCKPVIYTGSTCRSYLHKWQSCTVGTNDFIYIRSSPDQETLKKTAASFLQVLQVNPDIGEECKTAGNEFICQYSFPLCDCMSQEEYLPSREFCAYVSTQVCQKEWKGVLNLYPQLLPNCSELPSGGNFTFGNASNINDSNIVCSNEFYYSNGSCRPDCYSFQSYTHHRALIELDSQMVAASIGLFVGIIVLIATIIRWRIMLSFPSIFLVYMTIGICIVSLFVLIRVVHKGLFCSSKDLIYTFYNPTLYCKVTGVVFQYFLLNMTLWWIFHVVSIFYKIMFPMFAKEHKNKDKYIHIVLLVLGVTIPLPGVLLALCVENFNFTLYSTPSYFCTSKNGDLRYYSVMLPLNVFLGIGICLLVLVFWRLHKHQGIFRYKKSTFKLSLAEVKLLFALAYYSLFGVVMLLYFSLVTATQNEYINNLTEYFECEAFGVSPNTTACPKKYERYNYTPLAVATYTLMGLVSTVILFYAVNWRALAQFCWNCRLCHKRKYSKMDISTVNNSDYSGVRVH